MCDEPVCHCMHMQYVGKSLTLHLINLFVPAIGGEALYFTNLSFTVLGEKKTCIVCEVHLQEDALLSLSKYTGYSFEKKGSKWCFVN